MGKIASLPPWPCITLLLMVKMQCYVKSHPYSALHPAGNLSLLREAHGVTQLLDPMQEDLQSHSGEEGASIGTEGQSYELGVHQQQNMGAIGSTALSIQVCCVPAMTTTNYY